MDNYAEFLQRLDTTAASLKDRNEALGRVRVVVAKALEENDYGFRQWAQRLGQVEKLLVGKATPEQAGLRELHAVASNMQSVFRTRSERVGERLAAVDERMGELDGPIHDLNLSKVRLTTSRRVTEEREKLGRAVQDLAGTAEGADAVVPDVGLRDDLKRAREAVVLAEALLELKES
ncbi:hypothetical protein [Arthrobacter sp. CG_A4]|uniref:hypothetical protein n=1 Tax=Arthrobacter sp. CG_A4 TaxID=3071706 RepID=UPI002E0D0831|nr:hypothetical protein [Arthrobacter sp. CG_A4]